MTLQIATTMTLIYFTRGTRCKRWFSSNKCPELESLDEQGFSTISQTTKYKIREQDVREKLYEGDMPETNLAEALKGSAVFCMYSERLISNRTQYCSGQ